VCRNRAGCAHDYPAATSHVSSITSTNQVNELIDQLLPDNLHVAVDLTKVKNNRPLSPVLLIREDLTHVRPLQITDGYHRVCASYHSTRTSTFPAASPTTSITPRSRRQCPSQCDDSPVIGIDVNFIAVRLYCVMASRWPL
jgi:hypothetical protein